VRATHDAFGRRTDDAADARPTSHGEVGPAPTSTPGRRARGRALGGWLQVVLVVAGTGGAYATMRAAAAAGPDQIQAITFALQRDPFGPRSLVTEGPLRDALHRIDGARRGDEVVASVSASPDRVTATVVDPRDRERWISVDVTGEVRVMAPRTGRRQPTTGVDPTRLDVAGATAALRRHHASLRPHAHDPRISLLTDSDGGAPRGWQLSVEGVATDDRYRRVDLDGGAL